MVTRRAEVDALEALDEAPHEVPARLLAVGDDVDAGRLLLAHGEGHRVAHALVERGPWTRHGAHSVRGVASHAGLGKLPAMVVLSTMREMVSCRP